MRNRHCQPSARNPVSRPGRIGFHLTSLTFVGMTLLAGSASGLEPCRSARLGKADIPVSMAPAAGGTTYYVRTDGGDASQCDGRTDAPYPGKGVDRPCAWRSPAIALPRSGAVRIEGGDTLRIAPGTYSIGEGGAMQPVPSGPAPGSPTRVIGSVGAKLVGAQGIHRVLDLDGSSNVEIGHLEITDGSDCVHKHAEPRAACTPAMAWARVGLYARNSRNVWLHDLHIHGMAARGINAGGLRDWTLERVKLNRNGTAGWDGNVDNAGPNSGRMIFRGIEIGWNGCGERVATGEPWACWAQQSGGYGDGLGTTQTGGQWLFEDAHIHHNTSDGLDLRYMDGADSTHVTVRRLHAVANAGNQLKVKGNALIEDSVLVGHCTYFRNRFFMKPGDLCRGDGSTLQLVMTGNDTATVRRNTIAGEGAAQIGHSEGDASDHIQMTSNLVIGYPYALRSGSQSAFNAGKTPARRSLSGNQGWDVAKCPEGASCSQKPRLSGMKLEAFDPRPLPGTRPAGQVGAPPCGTPTARR